MGARKRKKGPGRGGRSRHSTPPPTREQAGGAPSTRAARDDESTLTDGKEAKERPRPEGGKDAKKRPRPVGKDLKAGADVTPGPFAAGGDPRVKPRGVRLWGLNLLIGCLFATFTIDALPNSFPAFGRLNQGIDFFLDVTGLAQGEWKLFSPDPDHINAYVEAVITYSDGSTKSWKTTDWRNRSLWEKFIHGRYPKFSDAFRMDRNKAVWPHLVRWVLTQVPPPEGARPTKVELWRHWWDVPKPADLDKEIAKYKNMPPDREEYPSKFSFFTKEFP